MPPRPVWFGYIAVDDVDAKAKEIEAAGGGIHKAPEDIPTIGRFAVVSDPQGAVFMLFKGMGEPPPPLGMMQTGSIGWHELHTRDGTGDLAVLRTDVRLDARMSRTTWGRWAPTRFSRPARLPIGGMMTDSNLAASLLALLFRGRRYRRGAGAGEGQRRHVAVRPAGSAGRRLDRQRARSAGRCFRARRDEKGLTPTASRDRDHAEPAPAAIREKEDNHDSDHHSFKWVPVFARGFVRDIRARWAFEEAGKAYAVDLSTGST